MTKRMIFPFVCLFIFSLNLYATQIKHMRVVWHEDPVHEANILWTTDKLKTKSYIYFDKVKRNGVLKDYTHTLKAKVSPYTGTLDFRHAVKLTGLQPNTTYYFIVKSKDLVSKEYHFKTAPNGNEEFKLFFGGDSRSDRNNRRAINLAMKNVFKTISQSVVALDSNVANKSVWIIVIFQILMQFFCIQWDYS